jgi:hypothetical protein
MTQGLNIKQTAFVAAYLGEANGNATEAARIAGYKGNNTTLAVVGAENIRKPYIAEAIEQAKAAILDKGIAVKQSRIDALNDRWALLKQLIRERADDPNMQDIPGGTTGLLVHNTKAIGAGRSMQVIDEYNLDTGLLKEMREHEKQAAQEVGDLVNRNEHTGPEGTALTIILGERSDGPQ